MPNLTLYGVQTLTPVGATVYNFSIDSGTNLEQTNEVRILVNTTGGAATINLPSLSGFGGLLGTVVFIVDTAGNAAVNNITVNCGGGDVMGYQSNSNTTFTISTNNGCAKLEIAGNNNWYAGYF